MMLNNVKELRKRCGTGANRDNGAEKDVATSRAPCTGDDLEQIIPLFQNVCGKLLRTLKTQMCERMFYRYFMA